jgi:hypothetical protein
MWPLKLPDGPRIVASCIGIGAGCEVKRMAYIASTANSSRLGVWNRCERGVTERVVPTGRCSNGA